MNPITEQQFLKQIPEIIASWFDGERGEVYFEKQVARQKRIDLVQKTSGHIFIIEFINRGNVVELSLALNQLKSYFALYNEPDAIPIIAVSFMGEKGQELCADEKVSWLDLSGNANVTASGLRIRIEGKPNLFKSSGRPKNLFAPKSSRIAREFLISPVIALTQRELTRKTELNETLVGRVVREMEREKLLFRNKDTGAVSLQKPELMLEAWSESYQFDKHLIISGFIAQRTGEATMQAVAEGLEKSKIEYAATGLAGAWLLTHFANFRLTTFYVKQIPSKELLKELKITEQSKAGANVWLVVPNDNGVFDGAKQIDQINCVHPVQVFLDLKTHPERAAEATQELRNEYLNWRNWK